jgi:putative membrane protein
MTADTETPRRPGPAVFRPDDPSVVRLPDTPADPEAEGEPGLEAASGPAPGRERRFGATGLAVAAGLALLALAIGWDVALLVGGLLETAPALGWLAAGLAGAFLLALAALVVREVRTLARLGRIEEVRRLADRAAGDSDRAAVDRALAALEPLYARRPDMAWAEARYRERLADVVDPADRLAAFEAEMLRPLDARARAAIARTAQTTAVFTAISPFASVDIALTAWRNFALVRRLATLYGGRPGLAGTAKLIRRIFLHLALTGGLEAGDSLAAEMFGGGMAAKVSARLGQGLINGLLTARVGIAALQFCRPLPFVQAPKPTVRELAVEIADGLKRRL